MNKKIGILAGMEWDHFPMALIQRINAVPGFHAELAKIDATPENFTQKYDVLVDRILKRAIMRLDRSHRSLDSRQPNGGLR